MRRTVLLLSLLLGLFLVSIQAFGKRHKTVDLIIFMGQSNMAGRGVVNDKHPEDAPEVTRGAAMEFRAFSDTTQLYPVTMASLLLDTFKEKGMMKDAFHYYQDAYNLVGDDAGCNTGKQLNALHS